MKNKLIWVVYILNININLLKWSHFRTKYSTMNNLSIHYMECISLFHIYAIYIISIEIAKTGNTRTDDIINIKIPCFLSLPPL